MIVRTRWKYVLLELNTNKFLRIKNEHLLDSATSGLFQTRCRCSRMFITIFFYYHIFKELAVEFKLKFEEGTKKEKKRGGDRNIFCYPDTVTSQVKKGKTSRLEFFYKFSNVEYFSSNTIGGGAMKIEMHPVYL